MQSYEQLATSHLIGPDDAPYAIGMMQLQKLNRDTIRTHLAQLAKTGKANGSKGGLAPASVRRVLAALSRAMNDAVESGLIVRNPAKGVTKRLPRPAPTSEVAQKAWNAEQLGAFLASVRSDRHYALWHLFAMTGLRRGEALALRLADFDSVNESISITKSRVPLNRTVVESAPKSEKGRRVVQLDPNTAEILRQHIAGGEGEYLFTNGSGQPLNPHSVSHRFVKAVKAATLPPLSLHGLRHTWASLALQAGVPAKVVQERLGHASVAITLDIYSHIAAGMDGEAAVAVANLVRAGGR